MQSESKSSTVWYVAAAGATVAAAAGVWYALRQRKKKDVPADGFKLVACDMDGTLLDANHKISPRNIAILKKLHDLGIHIVLCSGRMLTALEPYERALGIDMNVVCYNGAATMGTRSNGRPFYFRRPLPASLMNAAIDFVDKHNLVLNVYLDHKIYARCNKDDHWKQCQAYADLTSCDYIYVDSYTQFRDSEPEKVLILCNDNEVAALRKLVIDHIPNVAQHANLIQGFFFVELLHPGAHKLVALQALCDHLKIRIEECVGFGDGENDKEFLRGVGLGIAVQNAVPITKQYAKRVSQWRNTDDVVARELEALLEQGAFHLDPKHQGALAFAGPPPATAK